MSDEEQSFDEGLAADEDLSVGEKVGFLPSVLMKVLKWAALAIGAVIFIVTVVIITTRVMNQGTQPQSYVAVTESYEGKTPRYEWYDNIPEIRGRTADRTPTTVIVKVNIGYDEGDREIQTELIARTPRLRDLLRNYFTTKTAAELQPQHEEELKAEIREMINRIMSDGKIREVIFVDFNLVEF